MSQIVTFRLLVRAPPAFPSVCSLSKPAASVHGQANSVVGDETGLARILTSSWNHNPLAHKGSTFLEIWRFENGCTSSSR